MTLEELKEALRAADPAAVLVPGHLLARVIREVTDLPAQVIHVPHRKSFILDRAVLLRHAELDDLDLGPERMLPSKVILLARPNPDRRNTLERQTTLLKYWRRLFHANVHLHLERLAADKCLGPDEVAARVERIGATAFDEARAVLRRPSITSASSGGSTEGRNSRSTLVSGPAAMSRSSSARVAPNPARRCNWATLRRSHGSSGVGS